MLVLLALQVELPAQQKTLNGHVRTSAERPLQGASVLVKKNDSSAIYAFAISRADGSFQVKAMLAEKDFLLEIRHIGYETRKIPMDTTRNCCGENIMISLSEQQLELKEVVIKREVPMVTRSDTVVFNANSYRTPEVRKVEDLLKNIQGFTVDANGKLSFNGKAVDRVLIEGDDLADRGYQMITRNLDASLIEKVEVVDNFNTNRLMRNVERTNKVGINLRISSKHKAKLSGSGEIGASLNNRYVADLNNIFIAKKVKWLGFASYNNVARDPSGNVRYYYQQEGGQVADEDNDQLSKAVLETGSFNIPPVGSRYVKNNSDFGLAIMNSWKMGNHTRVNTLMGFNDLSLQNQTASSVVTEISDQDKWVLNNIMDSRNRSRDVLFQGSLQADKGKNHVRRVNLGFQWTRDRNRFSDILSGAARDSLTEELKNRISAIRLSWQETFLLRKQVFRIGLNYSNGSARQFLENRSARYLSFWGLDSSYLRNQHQFNQDRQLANLQMKMNGNKGRFQYEYGAALVYRRMSYQSQSRILSELQKPDQEPEGVVAAPNVFLVKGLFKGGVKASMKGRLSIHAELGREQVDKDTISSSFAAFNGSASYLHNFSLLRSLRLVYSVFNGFSDYDRLYPGKLLSGNGIILSGLALEGPVFSQGWTGSFHSNNYYKQRNWSLTINYKLLQRAYTMALTSRPELNDYSYLLTRNNRLFGGVFSWESFVRPLKGRLGATANYNMSEFKSLLNGVEGISEQGGLNAETWWTSGFNFPLNIELRGGLAYGTGRWNGGGVNTNWQYRWSSKLKFKSEKMYTALSWNGFHLSNRNRFFGLDLYSSYALSKAVSVQVTGVNLLNSGKVIEKLVMPYNRSQSMFNLVERYVLVSANISF
jgi:hypothetical protein